MVTGLIWVQWVHKKLTFSPCLPTLPLIGASQHLKSNGSEKNIGKEYVNIFSVFFSLRFQDLHHLGGMKIFSFQAFHRRSYATIFFDF